MRALVLVLEVVAPVFLIVAALHLLLGLNADALLGAKVSAEVAAEPSLDSQNRFYGVAFALYGVVLYICATDLRRFEPIFKAAMWVFFLGGIARLVSCAIYGAPALPVIALTVIELVVSPILLAWHARIKNNA
ncbi:MAG: hypothetical protein JWR07_3795 [Nevskia sp.]|nr:hypothetical protein [Nevskia sp.]